VFNAVHGNAVAEYIAEHFEFRTAEALAYNGGGADRAMVLQQQKPVAGDPPFRHIPFARTDLREARHTCPQRGNGHERRAVSASGFPFARAYELLQRGLPERRPNRLDQVHSKLGVRIRKVSMSSCGQAPKTCRPPNPTLSSYGLDQAIISKLRQLLPRGLRRSAESGGYVCGTKRPAPLDQAKDPVARIFQAHACIMCSDGHIRKHVLAKGSVDATAIPGNSGVNSCPWNALLEVPDDANRLSARVCRELTCEEAFAQFAVIPPSSGSRGWRCA
jgi:hypothetical protein